MRLNVTLDDKTGEHLECLANTNGVTEAEVVRRAIAFTYPLIGYSISEQDFCSVKLRESSALYFSQHSDLDKWYVYACGVSHDGRDITGIEQQYSCRKSIAESFFGNIQIYKDKKNGKPQIYAVGGVKWFDGHFKALKARGNDLYSVVLIERDYLLESPRKIDVFRWAVEQWYLTAEEMMLIFAPNVRIDDVG